MRLLLAEDDPMLGDALRTRLSQAGFEVELAVNGAVAEYLMLRQDFDVAVLDIGLPMVDGLTVLKRVRAAKPALPVLLLTALDGLEHRVAGLNAGADDYVAKPFDFPELEARIRALLRRSQGGSGSAALSFGKLSLEREAHRVMIDGAAVELSPREFRLLDLLLAQREKVVTKDAIAEAFAIERSESGSGSIEVYIHRVRRKLEGSGLAIRTVRGLGYLLEAE
jgi:two-component system OmpR family response regulator